MLESSTPNGQVDRPASGLRHRVAVGVAWAVVATWGQHVLQLAVFVVLGRLLGPEAYGTLAMALIVTASCQVLIIDGGWHEALIARAQLQDPHCDSVFWCVSGLGGGLAVVVALAAPAVAWGLDAPEVARLLPALSLTLPLAGLVLVPRALLHRQLRFGALALASWLALFAAGGVGTGMALADAGAWSLVGFHLTEATVALLVIAYAARWRPRARFSLSHLQMIFRYSRNVFAENALLLIDYLLPRFVIAVTLGPIALGYFSIARKVAELLEEFVLGPLASVALPAFAGVRAAPGRLAAGVTLAIRIAAVLAFPAGLGLAVVAPELVQVAMGDAWAPSAPILQLLALALLAMPVVRVARALMQGVGRVGWQLILAILSTALLALLVAALAPAAGVLGVALALTLQPAIMLPVYVGLVGQVSGIDLLIPLRQVLPTLTASGLMVAALLAWRALAQELSDLFLLAGAVPLGAAVYLTSLAVFDLPILREAWATWRALRDRANDV
jgi:O-antigen/teichoic acid export membrane protein